MSVMAILRQQRRRHVIFRLAESIGARTWVQREEPFYRHIIRSTNFMPYNDDGLIDPLETPNRHDSPSNESGPSPDRRSSRAVLLFALVALFIAAYFFLATVRGHPIGFPFVAMVGYTLLIALFALKSRVPWDRLTRGKFLLEHCLALAVVYGITAGAPTAEPHFPTWFTTQSISWRGARFSSFDFCLMVILFALAICEFFWRLRPEHEDAPEGE